MYVKLAYSKEAEDGGAVYLGRGGEGRPRLVRGLRLQDPQRGHGTLQLVVFSPWISKALQKVMFFLAATVKLQEDDNACLWIPTFLVPAFLSTIVAVYFVIVLSLILSMPYRGEICHCRHCRQQCKIFTSSVNFSRNNAIYNINESSKYILS